MMRLVDYIGARLDQALGAELLVMIAPDDEVVSSDATKAAFRRIDAPRKELVEFADSLGPSRHILAGDILAPDATSRVAATIIDFIAAGRSSELQPAGLSNKSFPDSASD